MYDTILKILKQIHNYKLVIWIFIFVLLFIIIFYPIIDANFLYYKRVSNRIDILDKVSKLDVTTINNNSLLQNEYNSIVDDISEKENKYLNNIFVKEVTLKNKIIKFVSAAWLFAIVGIIMPFTKNTVVGIMKFFTTLLCFGLAGLFGLVGMIFPTIINIFVNFILYQIILFYLVYTIVSSKNSKV